MERGKRYSIQTDLGTVLPKQFEVFVKDGGLSYETAQRLTDEDLATLNQRVFEELNLTEVPSVLSLTFYNVETDNGNKMIAMEWIKSATEVTSVPGYEVTLKSATNEQIITLRSILTQLGLDYVIKKI